MEAIELRDGFQSTTAFLYTRVNYSVLILSEILRQESGITENLVLRDIARMNRVTNCKRSVSTQSTEYVALQIDMIFGICVFLIAGLFVALLYFLFVESYCFKRFCVNDLINDSLLEWG